jgi:hypothetical protein
MGHKASNRSYDQKLYDVHPILAAEDLEEQHVPTLALDGLDLLVRKIASKSPIVPTQNPVGQCVPNTRIEWREAVLWAAKAWKTIYIALTARNKPEFFLRHPLNGAPAEEFISKYAKYYCAGKAIKLLKFHTTYLFAAHSKNETPRAPFDLEGAVPGVLAGGWVYKTCHRLMRGHLSDLARAADVLYSKYGMPKATEDFVKRTLEAHEKALTTPPSVEAPYTMLVRKTDKFGNESHNLIPATREAEKAIKRSIQTVANAVFKDKPFNWRHLVPKPSSCFERNTKNGGQIYELLGTFTELEDERGAFSPSDYLEASPFDFSMVEVRPGEVKVFSISSRKVELVRRFEAYCGAVVEDRLDDWLSARQFGILEPLKCRVILMAQAVEMYMCTALQRWMHGVMKKVPIFHFIGAPDTVEEISEIFDVDLEENAEVGELLDLEYVSGDYEAATDNIRGEFSSWAWSCVASSAAILNKNIVELGHKCLTRHEIYPALSRREPDIGKRQENGQSMGSPMSFPILCLVNAACWLTAYGSGEHPERLLWHGPVRVNGDDIVFRGPKKVYEPWWALNTVAGLRPSIGKNYRSRRFVNIDSHTYECRKGNWRAVKSVNTALVQDLVRKGINAGETTGIPWFSQKANFDYLVKGHNLRTQLNLKSMFLAHVPVPREIATDLGAALGGPGFSVGPVSLKARCQTAIALCSNKRDFPLKLPRPTDDSWSGRICQQVLTERTISVSVQASEDPLFEAHWRSESAMCSGDLLAALLDGVDTKGSLRVDCKNPILNPTLDRLEGTSGFKTAKFLRSAGWYELKVRRWFGSHMRKLFSLGLRSRLFPSDPETTLKFSTGKACVVKRVVGLDFFRSIPFGAREGSGLGWLV